MLLSDGISDNRTTRPIFNIFKRNPASLLQRLAFTSACMAPRVRQKRLVSMAAWSWLSPVQIHRASSRRTTFGDIGASFCGPLQISLFSLRIDSLPSDRQSSSLVGCLARQCHDTSSSLLPVGSSVPKLDRGPVFVVLPGFVVPRNRRPPVPAALPVIVALPVLAALSAVAPLPVLEPLPAVVALPVLAALSAVAPLPVLEPLLAVVALPGLVSFRDSSPSEIRRPRSTDCAPSNGRSQDSSSSQYSSLPSTCHSPPRLINLGSLPSRSAAASMLYLPTIDHLWRPPGSTLSSVSRPS